MKAIVVYTSKYGSTEKYARWIAQALGCPAKRQQDVTTQELRAYDTVIYGGGIYAGRVAGLKKFLPKLGDAQGKKLILFMVGMTSPVYKNLYDEWVGGNLAQEWIERFEVFYLQGDLLFSKMSGAHKLIMRMQKTMIEKEPAGERSEENNQLVESFGSDLVFARKESTQPVLDFLGHQPC